MAAGVVRDAAQTTGSNLSFPALVLLPGLEGSGELFSDLVSELPAALTVVVGKYPNKRFLSYSELIPVLSEIVPNNRPFVIVAESFSTPLAAMFAATHPPNLVGLIMAAGFITNPARNWSLIAKAMSTRTVIRISPPRWFLQRYVVGKNPPNNLESRFRHALQLPNIDVLVGRLRAILRCDARKELAETAIPLMYIQAGSDRLVPARCFTEIQRIRPHTVLESIPGAPHLVLQREPKQCAVAIMRFIAKLRN